MKAQRRSFLIHLRYVKAVKKKNKVQFLQVTTIDTRYYQTRNLRVGCKSKQHSMQSNREVIGGIRALFIYIRTLSKNLRLCRIWAPGKASSHCQAGLNTDTLFHTPSVGLPVRSLWQNLPNIGEDWDGGVYIFNNSKKKNKPPKWKHLPEHRLTDGFDRKGVKRCFIIIPWEARWHFCIMKSIVPLKIYKALLFWRRRRVGKPQKA